MLTLRMSGWAQAVRVGSISIICHRVVSSKCEEVMLAREVCATVAMLWKEQCVYVECTFVFSVALV